MTDQPGTPEPGTPEERLPATRPPETTVSAERFASPAGTRTFGLTPERAATIVRQSASSRLVGFLAVGFVILFIAIYYLYELGFPTALAGLPFVPNDSRLTAEKAAQQVTAVQAGYNVFEANCARCHGVNGEGGIGPVLHDQAKLYQHLNEDYLHNVLTVGGRYVCGNANSLMPVWADVGNPPGPLNYIQINDVIAFIRSDQNQTYVMVDPNTLEPVVDPSTGQEKTFQGWRDPTWTPAPGATPVPACWSSAFTSSPAPSASAGASGAPAPSGSPAPSGGGSAATTVQLTAQNIQYDKTDLEAPANAAFAIAFNNQDAGVPHNVAIKDASGKEIFKGDIVTGVTQTTYQVPALPAGTYTFYCSVHPNMTGTLTVK